MKQFIPILQAEKVSLKRLEGEARITQQEGLKLRQLGYRMLYVSLELIYQK